MPVIYILWLRELKRSVRPKTQIGGALAEPLGYVLALGYGLSPIFSKGGGGDYLQFLTPGVMGMTMVAPMFSGMQIIWDRQFGSLKETLVAPVPRVKIMLGRSAGVATVSILQSLLVLLCCVVLGFRPTNPWMLPFAWAFLTLSALAFTGLGATLGASMKNMQSFRSVMSVLMPPMFFFSGALFPLENLPIALRWFTWINPLAYAVDGLRTALIGQSYFGAVADVLAIAGMVAVVMFLGARQFSRIQA
jgi:ABC-2 type transport system permease protein